MSTSAGRLAAWWIYVLTAAALAGSGPARGEGPEAVRMATGPALSPDGSTLAYCWGGDVWSVPSTGGQARRLTRSPAVDRDPEFSPDGKSIAFASDRQGSFHPYVMPADGGAPRQVGFHSAGYSLQGWSADGRSLLVSAARDHYWREADRSFLIPVDARGPETPLFDAAGHDASLSPDGKNILFTREGAPWFRKGYRGSQASQIWLYDIDAKAFTKLLDPPAGALRPLWRPDGRAFYYVGLHKNSLNLILFNLDDKVDRPLTEFEDDSVIDPCLSRDGKTIVFRRLFDLYRYRPEEPGPPVRLEITQREDNSRDPAERRTLTRASQVAFSKDGLEVAFTAGGDLWVMDTELREPKQVTETPGEERDPVFNAKGDALLYVSDQGGQSDLWRAERADPALDWWRNDRFKLDRLTDDPEVDAHPRPSPEGSRVAYLKGRGDLWVMNPDGKEAKRVVASWSEPEFDWSPDGKWLAYAKSDEEFNQDVWVAPVDGSKPPFNLSRHPDNESTPVWSPDGKLIAFTGRREAEEVDVYFVWLREEEDDKSARERTLEKALEKVRKARSKAAGKAARPAEGEKPEAPAKPGETAPAADPAPATKPPAEVVIDFERVHERVRRVAIPDSTETDLFWSPDSKRLAFTGTVEGKPGVYTVEFPDDLKPKLLSTQVGTQARWLEAGNQIVWLSAGVPASLAVGGGGGTGTAAAGAPAAGSSAAGPAAGSAAGGGRDASYGFRALQLVDQPGRYREAFDLCWRTMRDHWYDDRLGNRNWDAVRRKYADAAAGAVDNEAFAAVVSLMLGELNGSHLGFSLTPPPGAPAGTPGPRRPRGPATPIAPAEDGPSRWPLTTAHLGLRFEPGWNGPGLKVRDVIPGSPADHKSTRVVAGELVTAVDGRPVDPGLDLTTVLNGPPDRDVRLGVRSADGKDRALTLRPITYAAARELLYDLWVKQNRKAVEAQSGGALGYLHIRGMNFPSFYKFEEELYSAGSGKAGLVIDVRENGGGSTTDHLLTALTQPAHAVTVPRGGGPGYPQDRRVYATWSRPIVVLCNQNSFSNAEIFSHAIKTLGRGKLVGTPTAGGVVSTGATTILDLGTLRLPTRGWFLPGTGEDMELNGAVPDYVVWPDPADLARGTDPQLSKAVEVLAADVREAAAHPKPKLRKATEREGAAPTVAPAP